MSNTYPSRALGSFNPSSGEVISLPFSSTKWVITLTAGVAGDGCGCGCSSESRFGVTVTGTSTVISFPLGNFTLTLTLGFWPAVSVVGIVQFSSTISHPFSLGSSICFLTSSFVIGVPTSTTIGVTFGVTVTGTLTSLVRITFPSLSLYSTVTVTESFSPGVSVPGVVSGVSLTVTVTPSGNPLVFPAVSFTLSAIAFSSVPLSVSFGTTTPSGETFGNTVTGTSTVSSPPSL